SSPSRMMSFDLTPFTLAMKPTPHASCSLAGSYRPCFSGALNTSDARSVFVCPDRGFISERQGDFVQSVQQAFAAERVHFKGEKIASRAGDGHGFKVDRDIVLGRVEQAVDGSLIQHDRGDAVLEG